MYEEYEQDPPPVNEDQAKKELKRSVIERGKYGFSYWEFALIKLGTCCGWVWKCCCWCFCCLCMFTYCLVNRGKPKESAKNNCCMRVQMRYERHEKAMEMFDEEFDIIKIIQVMRLTEFLSAMLLKKHQRALITNFQKNTVSDLGWNRWFEKNGVKRQMSGLSDSIVKITK